MNNFFLFITLIPAIAVAQPIPKVGNDCPTGYMIRGSYCEPYSSSYSGVIGRSGEDCPSGYNRQGGYCVPYGSSSHNAIQRQGDDCPSGYNRYKGYCIER